MTIENQKTNETLLLNFAITYKNEFRLENNTDLIKTHKQTQT